MCRSMQAELRCLAQHSLGADVLLDGSKFHAVMKRLTQLLLTLKRKHIKRKRKAMNNKLMATVIEERRHCVKHE